MKSESALALCACHAQTEWAKTEIDEIESDIGKFIATDPYHLVPNLDVESGEEIWRFKFDKLPPAIGIRVANVLANLRDPLDNILAIISHEHRGKTDKVSFPFGTHIDNYNSELEKLEKVLPNGATELIRKAETYPGGNAHLRALHFLNRDKKHRLPIAPFAQRTSAPAQALASLGGGNLIRVGPKNGRHLIVMPDRNLGQPDVSKMPVFMPDVGYIFVPAPGDNDMEILATTPGMKFYAYIKPSIQVAFTEPAELIGRPLGIELHEMRQLVEGILLPFERRFLS